MWLLERLLKYNPALFDAHVNLAKSTIELVWQAEQVKLSQIAHQIARLGYRAAPLGSSKLALEQKKLVRSQLVQIAIAGACSGNVMLIALGIYLGEWTGMAAEHLQLLRFAHALQWASYRCSGQARCSFVVPGRPFARALRIWTCRLRWGWELVLVAESGIRWPAMANSIMIRCRCWSSCC